MPINANSNEAEPKVSAVLEKVRKLLAKANDPSVTEAEAAAYAAKVASILQQHGLELADVPEAERTDGMVKETYVFRWGGSPWRKLVALATARLYFCEMIETKVYDKNPDGTYRYNAKGRCPSEVGYILVGRPHNVAVAKEIIGYLFDTTLRLSKQYMRSDSTFGQPERTAFERGCGERLESRLIELRHKSSLKTQAPQGSGLPVLYATEADLVKNFVQANMKTKSLRYVNNAFGEHAAQGRAAGNGISLSPQVAQARTSRHLLA